MHKGEVAFSLSYGIHKVTTFLYVEFMLSTKIFTIQEQLQTITVVSQDTFYNLARVSAINYYEENCSSFKEL